MAEGWKNLPSDVLNHIAEFRGYKKRIDDAEVWIGCREFKNGKFFEWTRMCWAKEFPYPKYGRWYVLREQTWKDGQKHGVFRKYNAKSRVIIKTHYSYGVEHGTCTTYYKSGAKASECNIVLGRRHGEEVRWDGKGNVISIVYFEHGVPKWTNHPRRPERFRS